MVAKFAPHQDAREAHQSRGNTKTACVRQRAADFQFYTDRWRVICPLYPAPDHDLWFPGFFGVQGTPNTNGAGVRHIDDIGWLSLTGSRRRWVSPQKALRAAIRRNAGIRLRHGDIPFHNLSPAQ